MRSSHFYTVNLHTYLRTKSLGVHSRGFLYLAVPEHEARALAEKVFGDQNRHEVWRKRCDELWTDIPLVYLLLIRKAP